MTVHDCEKLTAFLHTGDGVKLVMDVYLPASGGEPLPGPWPVVVERTPYDRANPRIAAFGAECARRGQVFVAQDVRGRGASDGHFHMLTNVPDEGEDGLDTVEWILAQPWCDGRIATVGGSFSAANQQALALRRPRGLRTQILRDAGTNYYRRMLRFHGLFNVGMVLPWVLAQAAQSARDHGDDAAASALEDMRGNLGHWTSALPLQRGKTPLALAPGYESIYFTMLETSDDTPYWHNPTARLEGRWDEYPRDVAILMISGWFAHHAAANFDKLRELGARSSEPVCLIVGPWIHGPLMLDETSAGEVDFGPAARAMGRTQELWLRWLHATIDPGGPAILPRLSYFVMGTGDGHVTQDGRYFHGGEWRQATRWPLPGTQLTAFHLQPGKTLGAEPADESGSSSCYVYDPSDPCPSIGGNNQQTRDIPEFILEGPRDQRNRPTFAASRGVSGDLCERADVLAFRSAPLERDTEVTGDLHCELWVSTSAADTDFMVRLIDEYPRSASHPGGLALLISEGALRLRYRNEGPAAEPLRPGEVYRVSIELAPTSNVFKRGHRIRLDITSSAFPAYDVNPNTGEPLGAHTSLVRATQQVFHSVEYPSALWLPLQCA